MDQLRQGDCLRENNAGWLTLPLPPRSARHLPLKKFKWFVTAPRLRDSNKERGFLHGQELDLLYKCICTYPLRHIISFSAKLEGASSLVAAVITAQLMGNKFWCCCNMVVWALTSHVTLFFFCSLGHAFSSESPNHAPLPCIKPRTLQFQHLCN